MYIVQCTMHSVRTQDRVQLCILCNIAETAGDHMDHLSLTGKVTSEQ